MKLLHNRPIDRLALRLVHASPGRMRFRGPARSVTDDLVEAIGGLAGVQGCRRSTRTGSLLVTFDPNTITSDAVAKAVVEHVGSDEQLVDLTHDGSPSASNGRATLATGVVQAVGAVDERLQHATRGVVGLRGLVPLALTLWAVRQVASGRATPLSWTSALWYAHSIFREYSGRSER